LLEQLIASGLQVHDDGDLPAQIWSPDRDHRLAQNAGQVTTSVQQLAENTDGRNTGPTLDQITQPLIPAARDQQMRTLSIGELNPTRCAGDPEALARFIRSITRVP
jgi:hypothetical protein